MRLSLLLFAAGLVCSVPACADELFTVNSGNNTISFVLPATITPAYSDMLGFQMPPGSITVNGNTMTGSVVDFYTSADKGGMSIINTADLFMLNLEGLQLFGGTTADPTFSTGTFSLAITSSLPGIVSPASVSITPYSVASTPEPATFALLGTGLLGVAGVIRRRLV